MHSMAAATLLLGTIAAQAAAPAGGASQVQAAFRRFQALQGSWKGASTKGWEEVVQYRAIAGGSAVLQTSFDAHPDETMATVFHLDGDRLLLTHYCVARNHPRMMATGFADGGRTVTFTFLDATNLRSRDQGHMDKVVFHFIDDDHFTSQWTWAQDGQERWMEMIAATRQKPADP
jgi:hypothetical protein